MKPKIDGITDEYKIIIPSRPRIDPETFTKSATTKLPNPVFGSKNIHFVLKNVVTYFP